MTSIAEEIEIFLKWLPTVHIRLIDDVDSQEHVMQSDLIKKYVEYRKFITPTVVMPWPEKTRQ